jgi:hypothetical protein
MHCATLKKEEKTIKRKPVNFSMSYSNSKRNIIVDAELVEIKMALLRMPFAILFEDYFFLVYLKFLPG